MLVFSARMGMHGARRPFTLPLGGSKTSLRVFGEGFAAIRKTLHTEGWWVKCGSQLQNWRFGLVCLVVSSLGGLHLRWERDDRSGVRGFVLLALLAAC